MKTVQITNSTDPTTSARDGSPVHVWIESDDGTAPGSRRLSLLAGQSHSFEINEGERVIVDNYGVAAQVPGDEIVNAA